MNTLYVIRTKYPAGRLLPGYGNWLRASRIDVLLASFSPVTVSLWTGRELSCLSGQFSISRSLIILCEFGWNNRLCPALLLAAFLYLLCNMILGSCEHQLNIKTSTLGSAHSCVISIYGRNLIELPDTSILIWPTLESCRTFWVYVCWPIQLSTHGWGQRRPEVLCEMSAVVSGSGPCLLTWHRHTALYTPLYTLYTHTNTTIHFLTSLETNFLHWQTSVMCSILKF